MNEESLKSKFFSEMEKKANEAVKMVTDTKTQCILIVVSEMQGNEKIVTAKLANGDKVMMVAALVHLLTAKEMEGVVLPAMQIAIERKSAHLPIINPDMLKN